MRRVFVAQLVRLARQDRRIVLLTADLGYTVIEQFREAFPDRFFNVGVAEQNMLGLATGLAEAGLLPFVYSIGTFLTARAYEFYRNGPLLHRLPVRLVGVGGGFEYGHAGFTHHVLEDVAQMRHFAATAIVTPADARQAASALAATWELPGPVYYRLGKDEGYELPGLEGQFALGRAQWIRQPAAHSRSVLLVALGAAGRSAMGAAALLGARGIDCGVLLVSCMQPEPAELAEALARYPAAVTVEAHSRHGGLGALAAELIVAGEFRCRLLRCDVRIAPDGISGNETFLMKKHGLDAESIARRTVEHLAGAVL